MEIQEKHRLEILNAKCNYVCAASTLVKKMNYGEDVSCCINKLYLASRIINRLECYCFDDKETATTETLSQWTIDVPHGNYPADTSVSILVDGKQVSQTYVSVLTDKITVLSSLFDSANITYEVTDNGADSTYLVTSGCSTFSIQGMAVHGKTVVTADMENTVSGVCVANCYNCIEDSDLPKMYEVLHKLLQ